MKVKQIVDEDFVNYRKPSMFIITPSCSFKCDKENGTKLCQNSHLINEPDIEISASDLVHRFLLNDISEAIVFGGLEPFDSFDDLKEVIELLRKKSHCDVVIYTGYNVQEIYNQIWWLRQYDNIIVKFGRYIPSQEPHYDEVLGVKLASDNQYAVMLEPRVNKFDYLKW